MKKFRVMGTTVVTVYKEVWANGEDEAMGKAESQLVCLTEYGGNGGWDKLIGVDNSDESVEVGDNIKWSDVEEIENDPNYFECPKCGEECWSREDIDGDEYWWCDECCQAFNEDGDEVYPDFEEEV